LETSLMPEIRECLITIRDASPTDPGAVEYGYYFVENGFLRMCSESGKPTGVTRKLYPGDDANRIARSFTRDAWRKRNKGSSDFNRPIRYGVWKPA
jgi:hypothetical protein